MQYNELAWLYNQDPGMYRTVSSEGMTQGNLERQIEQSGQWYGSPMSTRYAGVYLDEKYTRDPYYRMQKEDFDITSDAEWQRTQALDNARKSFAGLNPDGTPKQQYVEPDWVASQERQYDRRYNQPSSGYSQGGNVGNSSSGDSQMMNRPQFGGGMGSPGGMGGFFDERGRIAPGMPGGMGGPPQMIGPPMSGGGMPGTQGGNRMWTYGGQTGGGKRVQPDHRGGMGGFLDAGGNIMPGTQGGMGGMPYGGGQVGYGGSSRPIQGNFGGFQVGQGGGHAPPPGMYTQGWQSQQNPPPGMNAGVLGPPQGGWAGTAPYRGTQVVRHSAGGNKTKGPAWRRF